MLFIVFILGTDTEFKPLRPHDTFESVAGRSAAGSHISVSIIKCGPIPCSGGSLFGTHYHPRGSSATHLPFGRHRTQVTSPKKHPKASDMDAGSGTDLVEPTVLMVPSNEPTVTRSVKPGLPTSKTVRFTVKLPVASSNRPVPPVMVISSVTNWSGGGVPAPGPSA